MTQTTMARRVMLIHQLVLKGDLKELKKEIAKDIGLLFNCRLPVINFLSLSKGFLLMG